MCLSVSELFNLSTYIYYVCVVYVYSYIALAILSTFLSKSQSARTLIGAADVTNDTNGSVFLRCGPCSCTMLSWGGRGRDSV